MFKILGYIPGSAQTLWSGPDDSQDKAVWAPGTAGSGPNSSSSPLDNTYN